VTKTLIQKQPYLQLLIEGIKPMRVVDSMLELIGNTPVLRLRKVTKGILANVYVKLEYLNPGGSYKDRRPSA